MAGENNQNNQNEDLNDAVEQTDTNDAGTPSQQQNQQNQQNTIATTIATGAENTDAADEVNQALEDNPSGAGNEEEASASGGSAEEETPESDEGSDDAQSNVVGGAASDASSDDASGSGGGSGAGAQAVGGENAAASEGGSDAEGNEDQGQAARTSAAPRAEASESDEQQTGDDLDSQTVEETFAVDVEASDEETISEVEDDFDSETVNETFKIKVESENDAPEAEQNLAYIMDEDGSITFTQEQLLEYASDVDGDELVASNVQVGADATVQENGDGTFTVVPSADFNGELDLTFDISDGQETISSAIDLTVRPINDAPVPEDKTFEIEEDGTLTFTDADLLTGAMDIEGDNLTVEGVTYDGGDGILTDNGNGTYTFAPNENFNGDVNFGFDVSDGTDTVSANIDVSVTAVDDAPVSGDLAYSVDEDGSIRLSQEQLLSQASDVEGDDLTASGLSVGGNATVIQNDDGSFTITPDENFNGDIDISFDISDGTNTVQASADLTVNPINDLPVPQGQQFSIEEDGTLIFTDADLLTGATDIEGDNLTVEGVTYDGGDGILTDNGNGTYTFAPNENFNGDVNFGFDVSDGTDTVSANIDVSVTAVDDAPVSGDLAYSVDEDGSIRLSQEQLLSQASDVEGDDLTASGLSVGGNATVIQNDDGSFTITPDENFNGDIDISFDISDGTNTVQASADLTVNPVNDLPVLQDQQFSVEEDGTLIFTDADLLTGATDIEGDNLTVEGVTYDGGDGILTDNGNGTYTFAPNENFNGDVNFGFDVSDGTDTVSANIDVSVTAVDDAPVSGDLAYSIDEDGSIRLSQEQLLSQASDVEGDDLTASSLTVGGNATVIQNDDGSFTITPDENFNGDIDISFDIFDGTNTVQASADLTVNPVNDLPVPQDQQFSVEEDGTLIFTDADLLIGATDIESDNLTVEGVTYDGGDGILTDNGNGTYTFAPNENFNGDVNFGFDVSDGTDTVSANIDVSVTAVDDAPVSGDLAYSVDEDGSIRLSQEQLLSQASDVEGDDLTASGLTVGGDATVTQNEDGSFTITPDENFNGDIDISFDISDGTNTVQASADLTVNPINDLPAPQGQQFSIEEDGKLQFTDADLLTGATDIEGDNLTVEGVTYDGGDGILTDNGNGTYTFAPNENFNGDVNFGFEVSDGTDTVSANIDVSVTAVDDAPVSGDLAYSVDEDGSIRLSQEQLLSQASDVEGDDLTASSLTVDGDATVTQNEDGSFTITPDENFNGDIDISFDISDGTNTVQASADLTVNPVNDLPVPQDQQFSVEEDGTLIFTDADLLTGATDIEGDNLTVEGVTYDGGNGILTDNGDGTYTFAPNENFNGDVNFGFEVSDGTDTASANIDVSVTAVDDAPVSGDLAYSVDEDGSIRLSQEQLLSQASDVEGDDLTASGLSVGGNATVTQNDDGSFTITPDENLNGDIDISFDISDGTNTVQASADLTVNPINDLPAPQDQQFSIEEDGTLIFTDADLLTGATDIDGDDLTVEGISYTGGDGVLTEHGDGTYTFAPNENFNGDVNFSFDVSDGTETVSANIDVSVTPENDPPIAGSTSYMVNEDNAITISDEQLLANSSDIEGSVSVDSVTYSGTDGVFQDNGDGSYTFLPNENFSGDISLDVIVADEDGSIDETTAGITVLEVNDPPVAGSTSYTIDEDSVLTFSESQILVNASDVEGDVELVGINYDGSDGIFIVNGDGTFSFAPNENFNGQVQLGVTIQDEDGATIETHINVDVLPINDPPVSGDLAYTINEDSSVTLTQDQLLARAGDIDSDNLEAINLSTDENATIQHNDDGSYTITPDADYNGDLDLNFDIIDNDGGEVQVGLDITVNPLNDLPQAQDQQFTIEEDGILLFTDEDLLAGASDIDGDELSIENVLYTGADGVLSDNGDGTYSFAPNENFNGDVQFSFDVSDGTDLTSAVIDVSVTPENDPPIAGSTSYTLQEDGQITISDEQLLANSSDVEGDVSLSGVTYSGDDGSFVDNGNGTYTFTPNENFDGNISLDVVVVDEDGATATTTAGIDVIAVNDAPETSGIQAEVDEDNSITITQEQLLANATDVEGDELTASNLQTNDPDATIVANDDGSFTITHTDNFNGELDFTYSISDGDNEVLTTLDLTVNPVNDAPEAGEEIFIQAQEDQTVGVTLREEPALRLDQAPENGIIEANLDNEWVVLEVGQEVPADTEVRFVPSEGALAEGTHTTQIGTFDDNASVDDWGTEVDPYTREFSDGDLTVTVQSNDEPLGAWNGNTHIGHGIGDTDRQGLSGDEKLTVSVEGQDINEISFHLDGLGGWFMEESRHFTEVEIRAFNDDGELIDSMTYHKEDRSNYETDYTLTTSEPVSYFELGTVQGNGTYVVQNMTVSQTCPDEAVFTSIGVDGSEITETVELNIHAGDSEIELTADLPNITVDTEGSAQFASVVITEEQLLAQASDIDGDDLDIQNLELVGENSEHATLTDNGDGTWTVTPDENFYGEIELGYQVSDGELTDDNIININFESVNDAPIVSGPIVLSTDEDQGITFSADDLLANTTDVEGDALSISDITYGGDDGDLIDNGDGTFTFMPNENFNGEIDIDYKVFDGTDEVATHLDLTVVPVNDVPVPGEPLHTQMLENGSMIIEAKDLLSGATDVDGDILHVENLLLADQTQGTLTDNGDNTFTFEPTENFSGEVNLTFDISDGQASTPSTATVDVEIVNEGPEVSGPIEAAVDEDGSITITQEDLLANATDIDGDNLQAANLATNDPNAVITENSDGSFTITPSADFFGEIEFTYDVTDAIETVAADLNLTVNPINDAPDVPDMSFTTEDGQAITITEAELLAQATDVEGDELSVVNVTSANDTVEVTDNGDGTYTLTPEQGFFGNVDLAFDVSDGTDVVAANIDLKVEFVNDAPEATPMVADVDEDGSILVTQEMLLENASDQDGDELFAIALETNDPNASIVDNGDGTYTVTPSENFNGDIAFTYEVNDGELSTSNDMTLTVNPVNDIPIVAPGLYHIEEDGSILFTQEDLLSGAIDIDGDDLSVTSINYSGDEGTVTDNGDGTFSFVPEEHFSGDLQFSFTVTDGTTEVEQDLNVHIEAVADAPDLVITDGDGVNVDDQAILVEPGGIVELNIAAALVDQDLSETLTVTVDGVPEGSVIQYDNEGVLNDQENGITSYNDTEVTVTFEGETAGYQNAAGYYKVDEDGNITGVEVVYENASQVGGGGDLIPGQDQFSFQVEEGESFNLFLIPNGHQHNDFDAMQGGQYEFRAADGSAANMDTVDPQLIFIAADGTETVVQGENGDAIFHGGSSSQLNQDGLEHTRTTVNEDGELVYGFEDLYGGGDADYADFNFTIDVGEVNSQIYSGEVTVGPDGSVTLPTAAISQEVQIQLPEDFNQQIEVNVTATATELSNDDSETVSQTIYINATGVHIEHAPEALPVSATVEEDGSIIITQDDLLANARDLDGDQLTALNLATDDESVTITDNGDGTYTLTPDADFNGDVSFTFDVSDGDDVVSTNLELTVSPVNDGPEAQDQTFTVGEDGMLTFNDQDLLTGATDIEGDDLSVEGVTYTGADGVLTDNGDGTYSFAPNENFNGDVNFSFDVSDGTDTVQANIDVSVTPENDPPVAGSTSYTVHEDNSITISNEQLLANSSDIEGEVAIDSVTYNGSDGVLEINGNGTYTFSPNENFNGEISLDIVIVDEDNAIEATTAGITVLEVNDPPVAGSTSYTIDEDSVLTFSESQVLLNASDIEGDVELVEINYDGPDGIFSINGDGTCSFAPNENFNGQVQLDVTIQDEDGAQVDTYITVDVLPINDVPVSGDLAYSVEEDGSITLSQEQLLAQASDIEGDDLTAANLTVGGDATVTANDDGSFTITPDANFNGDIDLAFDINDGTDTLVATADLTVNPVNDLPQPQDQTFSIGEDGILNFTDEDLLTGATDIDGDDLSVEGVTYTGADGVLTDNGDGTYSFAPNENFNGDVNFSFDVSDGTDMVQANIDVSVTPENDPPVAGSTSYTVHEDNSITISNEQLLANSSDIEGEVAVDSVAYSGADGVFEDNGDGTYTFSPNANFNGEVSLDVVVTDEDGATATTTASIDVLPVNDAPVSGDLAYSIDEDGALTLSQEQLLAQASDIEGDDLTAANLTVGGDATVTANDDGSFTITPDANFNGDIDLAFDINDGTDTLVATADLTVNPVNDLPQPQDQTFSIGEDGILNFTDEDLLTGATDIDGDDLSVEGVTYTGADGVLTDNGDGTYSFAPNENFNGDVNFSFDVSDGTDTVQANIDVSVTPENDPPVAGSTSYTVHEDNSITISNEQLLANSSDIEGEVAVDSVTYSGADGVFEDNGDGTYTFSPNANFNGEVSLDVVVTDEEGATEATTAGITVLEVNDPPIAGSTSYSVNEDEVITISAEQLLANASDIEGEVAIDSVNYVGSDGIFTDNGDGTFSFAPNANFDGDVSLDVVVTDEDGATAATTTSIDVLPVNDAPVSGDLAYSIDEDGSITLSQEQLLAQASDVDGDDLTASNLSAGDNATVVDNGDGTFTVTPGTDFNGNIDLNFDISDGTESIVANADLTVNPVNDLPTTSDVYANVDEDNVITITQEQLLANSADIEGDDLVASGLTLVGDDATIVDNGDGTFSITPSENFNGYIDVAYSISDGDTPIAANLGLTVDPVNDAPIVSADVAITIEEDGSYTITQEELLQFATDIEDDDMTAIIGEQGDETTVIGTVLDAETGNPVVGADVTLTDNAGHTYTTVTDQSGNYTVNGPVVDQGSVTIEQEGSITSSFLVPAGEDVNGGVTAISEVLEETDMRIVVTWGESPRDMDNHLWLYDTENGNELDHIYYRDMSHDLGEGNVVQQDVDDVNGHGPETITIPNYQDADMHYSVHNYTNRSWDVDGVEDVQVQVFVGDTLVETFSPDLADNPSGDHWHVFDIVNGVIVPSQDVGTQNAFDLPTAEEALAAENGIDISELLSGDEDGDSGDTDGNEPSVGDISIDNALITDNGDGTYTITPEENFNGEFSISYNVDDGNGGVTPAELDVTVTAVNDLSVIYDHDYTINEDGSLTFTDDQLLAGATDIDGDDLSVESVNYEGTDGVFTDNGDGTYTFAPNENFNGSVDLTYDVSDGTDVVSANIDVQVVPINDVPVAGTTSYSVEEDGSITLSDAQLLANSSDVEGDIFVSDVSYGGTDGVFTDNGDGTYTFSPNENFNGDISLDVSVMDEDGATAETTAGIDVIAVNDLPVAGSTAYSVDEDNVIIISDAQLLANSSDIEGDVSVSDVSYSGADGIFTDNGDGTYSFAPNENFNGNVSLDVVVADEEGATAQTTAGIDVIAVNDAPVSGDLAYSVDEDGSITLSQEQLLAQASDVDGDDLTAANLTVGDNATVTANDDGSFTITPDADFNGDIDLSFDLSDGTETVVATADLTVNPVNDVAVVEDVAYTMEEDGSLTFTDEQLLAGASDIDGDELSVADVSYTGAEGVFTDNGDGTYTFAPNENFNGDVSLDFSVSDGTETVDANIDVTVTDVNDAPVAGATSYQMNEDGTITLSPEQLIANSSDVDGEVLLDSVSYSGADGILVQNEDGSVTFAPNENFNGDINLDVTVIDDDGATAETTAGIEVIAVNDAPVAGNVAYSVDEDGSITLSQEQLLANASDVDGDALTASNLSAGDNATVIANEDGSFTITPDADFNGDIDLSFDVSDGLETVQAGVDLTVNPVNDLPTAADQSFTVEEDGTLIFTDADLLAGAADIDGDDLSITDVSYTGAEGVFTDNGDGTYSFAPNENFNGDVSLDFSVSDGTETVNANIDVTVTDVNDAPVAGATSYQMNEDGTITLSPEQLIANSSDVDGDVSLDSVSYSGADGVLVQNEDGSVTFAPNENFNGDISLDVTIIDDDGVTATTTAGIEVLAVNDGPESEDVKLTTAEDSTILITQDMLLAQATDIDNTADELSASGLQIDPSLGELLDNEDGTWSFTPNENFNGDVPMTFNVSDGQETISVDGNIDVTPVNDAPEAPTIEMQGEEDVVMVIDPAYIADQVTDLDGDEISIESITVRAPANATLTQQPDGMYHLVTTQDFNGLVELGYQATDGEEVVDGSLNVDVIPVNDAPFNVGNAMMTTDEDGAFTFDASDLMNLFGDIDTADLVVSRIITADGEDGGEVTDNCDGTWTFTPTGDFAGVSDLQVVVSDGEFETVLDVPVYVRPVADGAVITTDHDGPLVFGEDETGHLGLNVGLVDDSETLSNLVMTGFPVGFEVTDGVNTVMITEPGQYIDLFEWDISNIQMTPPEDFHGEFFVTVSATTVDYGDEPEAFEDGIDSGDFETVAGDSIILTADDLIGLAENVDADSDDEVKLVHLADRSQGEIVDNGDGTWTFTPAPGFTGEADIAYVVDKDGVLHDEQTGVVVKEGDSQENAAPEVNSITTNEIAADATLSFTDQDMLANLSDAEGDSLSIESVSLMEGQGVIESDNQGNYHFTPAEDYTGDVQVGFIATDGENRIESFFNVDIQGGDEAAASEGYALADDGSLTITESQLVDELGVSDTAQVVDVADANDAGFFAESGEGEWTYWPNEDFDGNLAMNVDVNDGGEVSSHSLSIQVADDSAQSDEPQVQAAQATEEQQVNVAQQPDDQAQDSEAEDSVADVTAAPGDTISISIPDEVSGNESVDYAEMSGLPEGSTVSNALDNGDGSFTISGNLEQSVSVELPEGYEGTSEIQFQGYDELGSSIDGASGSVEVEVDDQYTMQGSTQEQQPDMAGMESGGSDWTSAGGQDQGVDFTDDSGSFDSDSQTGTDQGNDFDQSSI
ncbi:tandem-95 repeat protein [Vibrio toranzoniae]|nr:tandem-95 repeat protein [Vibrio toranzoniae]NAZ45098.1 tandem-95 repeat protein [Vibrio toranzoniae]